MDDPLPGSILLALVFLFLHAFFALSEIAVVNLDNTRLKRLSEQGDKRALRITKMLALPSRFLNSLRFGSLLMDVLAVMLLIPQLMQALTSHMQGLSLPSIVTGAIMLCCLLLLLCIQQVMGELLPKKLGAQVSENVTLLFSRLVALCFYLFLPFAAATQRISDGLARLMHIQNDDSKSNVTEEEIRMMVDIGQERGSIEEAEGEMIDNIFDFNNTTAEEIMTHRKDIEAICIQSDEEELARAIRESTHSRFPVYDEDIDDIVGLLHIRDYYTNLLENQKKTFAELLRPAHFVPENVRTDVLFRDLQKRSVHMAIVVDEYGGTSGVVTVEDLLEEIVGNIYDEYDNERPDYEKINENCYRLRGSMDLEDIEDLFSVHIATEDFDTLGGLIFSHLSQIPEDGSKPVLDAYGLHIEVEEIVDRRVERAIVCKNSDAEESVGA